jgi:hypothetical protein
MYILICCAALLGAANEPYEQWISESHANATLPKSIGTRLSAQELKALENAPPTTPYADLTAGIRLANGTIWAGSPGGLICLTPGAQHWRLFHSRRFLPDDQVLDVAVAEDGSICAKTKAGIARLTQRRSTLEDKMASIQAMLEKYHLREGLCTQYFLKQPGVLEGGTIQGDDDNDGLWTCLYVAAEAFRFGATGDEHARENAWKSLQAVMMREKITGIPGFAARSYVRIEDDKSKYKNWHRSADGKHWWKDDTSNDEIDGHFFAYCIYYLIAATEPQKEEIRAVVSRIADHIIDHNFYYVGPNGKPTTWGVYAPEKLNRDPRWIGDRGLNSLEILSHLKVAECITGNPRYTKAYRDLIEKHGYAANTIFQRHTWPMNLSNYSDDELAYVAYYPLVWLERDPKLRQSFVMSVGRTFQIVRPQISPFYDFTYAAALQAGKSADPAKRPSAGLVDPKQYDLDLCMDWFRRVPSDLISWTVDNSKRRDVGTITRNRHRAQDGSRLLPVDERTQLRWNCDPYQLTEGDGGRVHGDGAFILLPYWMGRYHRFIE